jgi:hypothetical protein
VADNHDQERVTGTIAGQQVGISVRDLLPIMLLASGVLGGYLLYQQMAGAVRSLAAEHGVIEERIISNYKEFVRLLSVMEWNCQHNPGDRLPLVLDHTIVQKRLPDPGVPKP